MVISKEQREEEKKLTPSYKDLQVETTFGPFFGVLWGVFRRYKTFII